jgi:N-acetylmuramic acid 6-phosphate etherase
MPIDLSEQLKVLITEERNPRTADMDLLDTLDLVKRIQAEDFSVPEAVQKSIPEIAAAVDLIVKQMKKGGRLIYFGAGTSGRLGILDASECPPTFGVGYDLVTGYMAGGKNAVFQAVEGAEDRAELAEQDIEQVHVMERDIVCGITASGRTPYVIAALRKAKELGAATIAVINNDPTKAKELVSLADVTIAPITGPEALCGSTRMKAGSAQKMVLNLLTTCAMVRLGKTYENLMIDLSTSSEKLANRAITMISTLCLVPRNIAENAFEASGKRVKTAIIMITKNTTYLQAEELLIQNNGSLRKALTSIK